MENNKNLKNPVWKRPNHPFQSFMKFLWNQAVKNISRYAM